MSWLLLSALLAGQAVPSSGQALPRGQLVENLVSISDPAQRYAVYLPMTHDPAQPAPLLILMDPRGRARIPAELFREAAERFGYVLFSSYNTVSDGPIEPNLQAMQAIWDDAHRLASIDDRRIYLVGFSGTARVACLVAGRLAGRFAGVVAAGAGFPPGFSPSKETSFLYYATIGDLDFNYAEVMQLEDTLVDAGVPHRIREFSGPHGWMPSPLAMDAIAWLELRAMQAGLRPVDEAFVGEQWARDLSSAESAASSGAALVAARRYGEMAGDYGGLADTAVAQARSRSFSDSREARQQQRARQGEFRQSVRFMEAAMRTLAEAFPRGSAQAERSVSSVMADLNLSRLTREAAGSDAEAMRARRRLTELGSQLGFYLPREATEVHEYRRAAFYLQIAATLNPSAPGLWYSLAVAEAQAGRSSDALEALEHAVEAGFRNSTQLHREPAFAGLRDDPRYLAIAARIGGRLAVMGDHWWWGPPGRRAPASWGESRQEYRERPHQTAARP